MTDIGNLTAHIGLDTKDLEKGHARSRAILGQLGSQTGDASARFGGLGFAVGKVGAALTALGSGTMAVKFLKDSIAGAMESQTAWNDLTAAITRHGGSWSVVGAQIETFAGEVQRSFGISDEAVAQSIQRFVDYGMSTSTAMQMTRSAIDLSVGAHVDLESAVKAIARGYAGNTGLLQRLTGVTEEAADGTEKFAVTMERLQKMFQGAAAAQLGSYTVKVRTLGESFSEASEAFGGLLMRRADAAGLADVLDRLAKNAFAMADAMKEEGTARGRIKELRSQLAALPPMKEGLGGPTGGAAPADLWIARFAKPMEHLVAFRQKLQQELDTLLAMQRLAQLASGWKGVPYRLPSDLADDATNLKEGLLRGIGPSGPTSGPELGEALKKQAEEVKQANEELLRLADERGWIYKKTLTPSIEMPAVDDFTARISAQADALRELLETETLTAAQRRDYAEQLQNAGGMSIQAERDKMVESGVSPGVADALAAQRMRDMAKAVKELGTRSPEAQKRYEELMAGMTDATSRAMDSIVQGFLRGRVALGDIFRGMAEDFISMFLRQIAMKIGAKLAGALLGFVLGGPAGAAGGSALGDWAIGSGDILGKPVAEPSYLGRLAPAQPQSSVLVITPPMSVSQDYIRKVVAPELRRLALNGARY